MGTLVSSSRRRRAANALFVLVVALAPARLAGAAGAPPGAATPVQREQAQAFFARGKVLMAENAHARALAEFRASIEIVASPNTRLSIARCLRALGRDVEAYVEFGRTAVEARELVRDDYRYEKAAQAAIAERAELVPRLGFVRVQVEHSGSQTRLRVGTEQIARAAWIEPAPVAPGEAVVVVETQGKAPIRETIVVQAGETATLRVDAGVAGGDEPRPAAAPAATSKPLERLSERRAASSSPLRTAAWISVGVGAAGVMTFSVFGVLTAGTYAKLNRDCLGGVCPTGHADDIARGRSQQTIANVGLAVGAVGIVAGATLFVVGSPKAAKGPSAGLVVAPGWIGVRGAL